MSLYNTERPQTLSGVIGQKSLKEQLQGMLSSDKLPNALLFIGPRGTGKTTVARIVAKKLNCASPKDGEPCNECPSCKEIMAGKSPDVVELDAASHNKVEDAREILQQAKYAPIGIKKVFILDEVHMFSNGAWNALLKLIEEPPKGVLFVLCTTEEQKVPATIISRCRKCNFEKIALSEILELLKEICDKHMRAYEEDALKMICRASDGCVRDALSIMEAFFEHQLIADVVAETLGMAKEDVVFTILNSIQDGNVKGALDAFHKAQARGVSMQLLLKGLLEALTDAIFALNGAEKSILNTDAYKEQLKAFTAKADARRCMQLTKALSDVYASATRTADATFLVESAIISTISHESELVLLGKRIAALESRPAVSPAHTVTVQEEQAETICHTPESSEEDAFLPKEWDVELSHSFARIKDEEQAIMDHLSPFEEDTIGRAASSFHADDEDDEVMTNAVSLEREGGSVMSSPEPLANDASVGKEADSSFDFGGLSFVRELFKAL